MLRKIASVLVNNVLVYVLGMVYTVISARLLGPGQRGILVVAVLVPTWVATLSQLGLPQALIYNLSRAKQPAAGLGEAISVSLRFLCVAVLLITVAFAAMSGTPLLRGIPGRQVFNPLLLCYALVIEAIVLNLLAGLQDFKWRNIITLARPLLLAIVLVACFTCKVRLTPVLIVQFMAAAATIAFVLGGGYLIKAYRPQLRLKAPDGWKQDYIWYGIKFYVATVAQALNYRLDTLIVNAQMGSADVGLYSTGVGAAELLLFIPVSVTFVFYPKIAAAKDALRNRMTLLTLGVSLYVVGIGGAILFPTLPALLPWAFGKAFAASVPAAQWLIPGMIALTIVRILSYAAAGVGKPEYATYTMLVGVLGTVPLDLLLIPRYGILGAAIASTVAYSCSALVIMALYARLRGISAAGALDGILIEPLRWLQATTRLRYGRTPSPRSAPTAKASPASWYLQQALSLSEHDFAAEARLRREYRRARATRAQPDEQAVPRPAVRPAAGRNARAEGYRWQYPGAAPSRWAINARDAAAAAQAYATPHRDRTIPAPKRLVVWAFTLFVLVIPFDTVNFPSEDFALTKFVGILFVLIALFGDRAACFRRPPQALWLFALYAGIYAVLGVGQAADYRPLILSRVVTLAQLVCLLWIAYNLMRYPQIARRVWLAFIIGCLFVSFLQVTHIGGKTFDEDKAVGTARSTSLGANANQLCGVMALGGMALVGLAFGGEKSKLRPRWLVAPVLAILGAGMLSTVSRGGIMAMGAGLGGLLLSRGSIRLRTRNRMFVVFAVAAFVVAIVSLEFIRVRFEQALLQGNLAKRQFIYPAALDMFREQPFFGWGPVAHRYELGRRTLWIYHHEFPDTHNLFLWIATESGLLGLATYFTFIALCFRAAWRGRNGQEGIQPLGMLLTLAMLNTSGTWIYYKLTYLTLAYALASAEQVLSGRTLARARLMADKARNRLPQAPLPAYAGSGQPGEAWLSHHRPISRPSGGGWQYPRPKQKNTDDYR